MNVSHCLSSPWPVCPLCFVLTFLWPGFDSWLWRSISWDFPLADPARQKMAKSPLQWHRQSWSVRFATLLVQYITLSIQSLHGFTVFSPTFHCTCVCFIPVIINFYLAGSRKLSGPRCVSRFRPGSCQWVSVYLCCLFRNTVLCPMRGTH